MASDSRSFERGPTTGPYNDPDVSIHQWALAGWGLPLGEMFDLEELAETARRLGGYSFFLTSVPIKVSQRAFYIFPLDVVKADIFVLCRFRGAVAIF